MDKSQWKKLLESILATEAHEISCYECYKVIDQYVDLLAEGTDPVKIMPMVKKHLECCSECAHVFEALQVMIEEVESSPAAPGEADNE